MSDNLIPAISDLQRRNWVHDWTVYNVRAFLYSSKYCSAVQQSVLNVGFTGRVLLIMVANPEYYWDNILSKEEDQDTIELFKIDFLSVQTTSASWMETQKAFDLKYLGDRLILNNYFDDGVSSFDIGVVLMLTIVFIILSASVIS